MKNSLFKFTLPSILIIVVGIIGLVRNIFFAYITSHETLIEIINLCMYLTIGLLLNKQYSWPKYIVLIMAVFGLINFPIIKLEFISLSFIAQRLLFVVATIILFKPLLTQAQKES